MRSECASICERYPKHCDAEVSASAEPHTQEYPEKDCKECGGVNYALCRFVRCPAICGIRMRADLRRRGGGYGPIQIAQGHAAGEQRRHQKSRQTPTAERPDRPECRSASFFEDITKHTDSEDIAETDVGQRLDGLFWSPMLLTEDTPKCRSLLSKQELRAMKMTE